MIRRCMVTLGMVLVGFPGITPAQEQPQPSQEPPAPPAQTYQYENDQGEMTSDEPAPQGEAGTYSEYNAAEADVSVDLAAPGASVNFQTFQAALSPYGEWVDVPPYGRVWRPSNVSADWKPYYYGHWEWTDEGWLWASDEPWGWAPYHYGRWTVAPSLGWVWVPGYQWAPAWVSWRFSSAAVGWAPLLPGFSVYVNTFPDYYVSYFTFVPCHRFVGVPVRSIAYGPRYAPRLFGDTRPAPPRASFGPGMASPAWGGPVHSFMEQRMGRPIAPARIVPVGSPGQIAGLRHQGVIPVYRPEVRPSVRPGPGGGAGFGSRPGPAPSAPMRGPGAGPGPAAGPGFRSGPPSYVPGRGPAPAPGSHGGGTGYAPGPGAPRPSYGPPNGYAPARPPGGYAPGPGRSPGSSAPPPSRGFAPPPRGGGFAPHSRGGGSAPAPSGGGHVPHAPSGGGGHGGRHER
jgi:hypothetical protein